MKRVKRLRRATTKPKRKAPEKTITLTAKQFRELLGLAKGAHASRSRAPRAIAMPEKPATSRKAKLTRAEAVAKAREHVLGPILKDFKQGKIDADDVAQWEERRADLIADTVREMLKGPSPAPKCSDCNKPSTTVMNGEPYCSTHAREHRQEYAA